MPLTVVVGGQYGSEGKGKLVSYLACTARSHVSVVRCGGSNAGHTAQGFGRTYLLRQLPSGVVANHCRLYLAAGMLIDPQVLFREIAHWHISPRRLRIDRNAAVITEEDIIREKQLGLRERLGSTLSGTGSATARKVLRDEKLRLASDVPELSEFIGDVSRELNEALDRGDKVIVEGTQGFGLSLHHSDSFPFVTSRDTTAAAFLSEVGLSPRLVTDLFMVLRSYPIRVGGYSGPMRDETTWDYVAAAAGHPKELVEYTTVTGILRRVGEFDWALADRAVQINRPTALTLHGVDYIDYKDYGKRAWQDLGPRTKTFVHILEKRLGVPVAYVFTGPEEGQIIDRRRQVNMRRHFVTVPASRSAGD